MLAGSLYLPARPCRLPSQVHGKQRRSAATSREGYPSNTDLQYLGESAVGAESQHKSLSGLDYTDAELSASTAEVQQGALGLYAPRTSWLQSAATSTAIPAAPPYADSLCGSNSSAQGFVLALGLLLAVRLGREQAELTSIDRPHQEEKVLQWLADQELLQKRKEYDKEEAQRRALDTAAKVEEARARAEVREAERRERERQMREAAERQAAQLRAQRDAEAKRFQEQEAVLKQEFERRVAAERAIIEEQERKAAEERERKRRQAEEERLQVEEARRRREEEEARAAAEAAARRQEERAALRRLQRTFAVRMEGAAAVERPAKGVMTEGQLPKEAAVKVEASMGSALGGAGQAQSQYYASIDDARDGALALAAAAARDAADQYISAVRMQAMTNEGALQHMDEVELQHWMNVAACRSTAVALDAINTALSSFASKPKSQQQPFQIRTERGLLPVDHPKRVDALLGRAIASVEAGRPEEAVDGVLLEMMEEEDKALYKDLPVEAPKDLGAILVLAHFLDRSLAQRPPKQSDAPAWFERAAALARSELAALTRNAPKDSLPPIAAYLAGVLGERHPVAQALQQLAEANLSAATKARLAERQRMVEAELAARLLEEEWPDASEIASARAEEREASTPIPERIWALRNVAGTLALGGAGEKARARKLLEQAVALKQRFTGSREHPGLLPELEVLGDVLESVAEWREDAVAVRARSLRILSLVAERFRQVGDVASATVLLEAAVRRYEEALGLRHPGIKALTTRAERLFDAVPEEQRLLVAEKRRLAGVAEGVIAAFTEELAAYTGATQAASKAQQWDKGGVDPVGPLL